MANLRLVLDVVVSPGNEHSAGKARTGSLRKVRWARQGMGKQGGARVIYFNRLANGEVVLLLVYAKAKFDNLRPELLLKIKEKYDV